jgi:hypothetical protein
MSAITWEDAVAHYAALSSVDARAPDDLLAFVHDGALSASVFGGADSVKYKLARIHYLAHVVETEARKGAVGPVASKTISAESLSVSYASAAASSEQLLTTSGGSALWSLMRSSPSARIFARCLR